MGKVFCDTCRAESPVGYEPIAESYLLPPGWWATYYDPTAEVFLDTLQEEHDDIIHCPECAPNSIPGTVKGGCPVCKGPTYRSLCLGADCEKSRRVLSDMQDL